MLNVDGAMLITSTQTRDNASTTDISSVLTDFQNDTQETSFPEGCIPVAVSDMEYLPWDNPDNIVSAETEEIARRIKNTLLALLFLIGGPGNVINMAVFYKQGLKDRVNLCLFALALTDALYLISAMCYHGEQLHIQFTTKERYGPMYIFMVNNNLIVLWSFSLISPILSTIIACERCLCVFNPLRFQTILRTRSMAIIIIGVYIVVEALIFIVAFRYRIGCAYDPVTGMISNRYTIGDFYAAHKMFIDILDSYALGAGVPGLVITVVITTTILTIMKLRQAVTWRAETSSSSSSLSPREVALTKMLVGNSILFIVCIFPIAMLRFSWIFLPEMNSGRRHHNFFLTTVWTNELLSYFNASFNIFVYYVMGSRYRETFWALLRRKQNPHKG